MLRKLTLNAFGVKFDPKVASMDLHLQDVYGKLLWPIKKNMTCFSVAGSKMTLETITKVSGEFTVSPCFAVNNGIFRSSTTQFSLLFQKTFHSPQTATVLLFAAFVLDTSLTTSIGRYLLHMAKNIYSQKK